MPGGVAGERSDKLIAPLPILLQIKPLRNVSELNQILPACSAALPV